MYRKSNLFVFTSKMHIPPPFHTGEKSNRTMDKDYIVKNKTGFKMIFFFILNFTFWCLYMRVVMMHVTLYDNFFLCFSLCPFMLLRHFNVHVCVCVKSPLQIFYNRKYFGYYPLLENIIRKLCTLGRFYIELIIIWNRIGLFLVICSKWL